MMRSSSAEQPGLQGVLGKRARRPTERASVAARALRQAAQLGTAGSSGQGHSPVPPELWEPLLHKLTDISTDPLHSVTEAAQDLVSLSHTCSSFRHLVNTTAWEPLKQAVVAKQGHLPGFEGKADTVTQHPASFSGAELRGVCEVLGCAKTGTKAQQTERIVRAFCIERPVHYGGTVLHALQHDTQLSIDASNDRYYTGSGCATLPLAATAIGQHLQLVHRLCQLDAAFSKELNPRGGPQSGPIMRAKLRELSPETLRARIELAIEERVWDVERELSMADPCDPDAPLPAHFTERIIASRTRRSLRDVVAKYKACNRDHEETVRELMREPQPPPRPPSLSCTSCGPYCGPECFEDNDY